MTNQVDPKVRRMRIEAIGGFLVFWTVIVALFAIWRIATGEPSVGASIILLAFVIADWWVWRKWRDVT